MNKDKWLTEYGIPCDSTLLHASGQWIQIVDFEKLAKELNLQVTYEGYHLSKSVRLPVVCFTIKEDCKVYMRHNFHDLECMYDGISIDLYDKLDLLYNEISVEDYNDTLNRAQTGIYKDQLDFSTLDWYEEYTGDRLTNSQNGYYRIPYLYLQGISEVLNINSGHRFYVQDSTFFGWNSHRPISEMRTTLLEIKRAVQKKKREIDESRERRAVI